MEESSEDRLIGDWHELAKAAESGMQVDLPAAIALLDAVLRIFAPSLDRPEGTEVTPSFIVNTRHLERTWNRYLGKALIEAGDAMKDGNGARALDILDRFIQRCPWAPFASIAKDQRTNCSGGR